MGMGFLLVFIGSGLGGMMRHGVGLLSLQLLGPNFPYGTLAVNIAGSALIGLAVAVFPLLHIGGQEARLFAVTGILGGFTTFSAFSLDTVALWERGQHGLAAGYVLLSVVLSLGALIAALLLARRWM